ncbi:hypothetical protein JQ628_09710 [Bradyrhizobium lablabi]|uniref:hypothetical protein n=1 Tax=Bradyrhizobium lablabi TaxID=722472 RepID=UPI001BAE2384|nr:hypothetical protein [Bradyrhizobium lablabi]MBR1121784.1 hypothetical protein [Bradyrhizobium lablabi]
MGTMPFVAVIGGMWNITDRNEQAKAKQTANMIGEELAKAGFGLVVYFSNDASLEPHVVSGYVPALAKDAGEIRVRYAQSQRNQVKFAEEGIRKDVFKPQLFPDDDWEAPFYGSLAEENGVDAVLLLSGAKSTLIAGQIAVGRKLPVLAVDTFGGSAEKIWRQLSQASPDRRLPSWGDRPASEFVATLKAKCAAAAAQNAALRNREADLIERERKLTAQNAQIRKIFYSAGAFLALLLAAIFGMAYPPSGAAYPVVMGAGLIAAGATGALVRALLGKEAEIDPRMSLLLGAIAGFVVGLAYLIPQWIGAPGVLDPKATVVSATDKIQFVSAVLIAISAGVGFDTVFSRLQKQSEGLAIGPGKTP